MTWVKVGDIDVLECGECDGTWIESATFERLCADRDAQSRVTGRPAAPRRVGPAAPVRYRPCPKCRKLMNRFNFGHVSGTVVDVCRGHGTFLDRGELHRIVQFVLDGGLDRARAFERDALAAEARQLREQTAAGDVPSLGGTQLEALVRAMLAASTGDKPEGER